MSDDDLRAALQKFANECAAQAQKAEQQGRQLGVGNIQQAFYQRGLAEGLRRAQFTIEQLLEDTPPPAAVEPSEPEEYVSREREAVLALLLRSGLKVHDLHNHNDNSYSLILTILQSVSYEDELERLAAAPNVVILAHGKLPNSNKAYIDFAFRKPSNP